MWIRGDKWHKSIDLSNVSRYDWRPEIFYRPKASFWRILFSPKKWANLYPQIKMAIAFKTEKGEQIGNETVVFRAIRFYYQLTGIVAILVILLKAHKYRFHSVFKYILEK